MAQMEVSGTGLFYRLDGVEGAPALVLSNSLGTTDGLWEPQMAGLERHFRVLRYDTRGHGGSGVSEGPYTIEGLGRDVLALLDGLGIERASFCGISMGGMIGMWLGVNAPERIERLALCNTSARIGAPEVWNQRIATVHERGMEAVVPAVIERWFTEAFRGRSPAAVERIAAMLRSTPVEGYAACCAAVRDMDLMVAVERISAPTLVVAGSDDTSTPPEHAVVIAERISGARVVELDAAHPSTSRRRRPSTPLCSIFWYLSRLLSAGLERVDLVRPGESAGAHVGRIGGGGRSIGARVDVAAHELRRPVEQAQHVVDDQDLAVAAGRGADADGRGGDRVR